MMGNLQFLYIELVPLESLDTHLEGYLISPAIAGEQAVSSEIVSMKES